MIGLGDELGPRQRAAVSAAEVAAYVGAGQMREQLFTDAAYAQRLGFADIIVPGPMLTAFIERFLRAELPGWRLQRLSTTFRVPTPIDRSLVFRGAITEHHELADGERLVCDILIEHHDPQPDRTHGERAVTGTATLYRPR